jgi:hypothetical protein
VDEGHRVDGVSFFSVETGMWWKQELEENFWDFVLGVDLGYEDSTAFVVLAFSEDVPEVYCSTCRKESSHGGCRDCGEDQKVGREVQFVRSVVDTGGFGKMITEEMNKRFELNLFPAEKARKLDHITLMNSDFERGRIQIVRVRRRSSTWMSWIYWSGIRVRWRRAGIRKQRIVRITVVMQHCMHGGKHFIISTGSRFQSLILEVPSI